MNELFTAESRHVKMSGYDSTFIPVFFCTEDSDDVLAKTIDTMSELVERVQSNCKEIRIFPICKNYDSDPRESSDIPEVVSLFKRVIDAGLYGLLTLPGKWNKSPSYKNLGEDPQILTFMIAKGVKELNIKEIRENLPETLRASCGVWNQRH